MAARSYPWLTPPACAVLGAHTSTKRCAACTDRSTAESS